MPEYIEREAVVARIKQTFCFDCDSYNGVKCRACLIDDALLQIEDEPAADVAPVVHGEWIHNTKREYDYICSVCRGDAPEDRYRNNAILTPYCPHCGAKMDGGEKG